MLVSETSCALEALESSEDIVILTKMTVLVGVAGEKKNIGK
jgi:hypothetical protein